MESSPDDATKSRTKRRRSSKRKSDVRLCDDPALYYQTIQERKENLKKSLPHLEFLTTGQVALICDVAPRTAVKWIEAGLLPFHRIINSKDRRIRTQDLCAFLRKENAPQAAVFFPQRTELTLYGIGVPEYWNAYCKAVTATEIGYNLQTTMNPIAIVGDQIGYTAALQIISDIKKIRPHTPVILMLGDDRADYRETATLSGKYLGVLLTSSSYQELEALVSRFVFQQGQETPEAKGKDHGNQSESL